MAYFGDTPWHEMGVSINDDEQYNWKVFAEKAGLDWEVELKNIYQKELISFGINYRKIEDKSCVRRMSDSKILGIVGNKYKPIQNEELFTFFDPFVESGLARYHTAGSLYEGKGVWVLAQIGEMQDIHNGDMIGQFILMNSSHDGSHSLRVTPTTIRVVCANTNGLAISGARNMRTLLNIRHTETAQLRIDQLQSAIGPAIHNFNETIDVFRSMAKSKLWSPGYVLERLWPTRDIEPGRALTMRKNMHAKIITLYDNGNYDDLGKTKWGFYNAITQHLDHNHGRNANTRLNSSWFGTNAQFKQKALQVLSVAA